MPTNKWSAADHGVWSAAGNWSLGHEPIAGEDIVFDATSIKNCTLDEDTQTLKSFSMAAGYSGTVNVGEFVLNVTAFATSDLTGTQGTLNGGSGVITVSRNIDISAAGFTFACGTGIVIQSQTGSVKTRAANTFNTLQVATLGYITTLLSNITCALNFDVGGGGLIAAAYAVSTHNLTVGAGYITATGTWTIAGQATDQSASLLWDISRMTFRYNGETTERFLQRFYGGCQVGD